MSGLKYFLVDVFVEPPLKGNPAIVVLLEDRLSRVKMQKIAADFNQPIVVFALLKKGENPLLQYFRPSSESQLCGHGTLAFAHVYFSELNPLKNTASINTMKSGTLLITETMGTTTLQLPILPYKKIPIKTVPSKIFKSLSESLPVGAFQSKDLIFIYEDESLVINMQPDFEALRAYESHIVVTAKSKTAPFDFISRVFFSSKDTDEDMATATAHIPLASYWSNVLQKQKLVALQASSRGAVIRLELKDNTVLISAKVRVVLASLLQL